ncbi:DUF92 domain-containing protein [Paenibacillus bouchesdurhonensis]|uniref:DUF92 domain-containing protein n=1 Tax=Paenibacillus bouchesdurhonensis TaxID=1870990 RepID=UPI000DA603A4|nr:DUF92 domain-containing protein [Paenibacillus bouchesdurhonensis]
MNWIIGAICAIAVSAAAYWKRSLSLSGMIAAAVMGTVYFGAGNLFWFGILLLFFVSSSVFSKLKADQKRETEKSYAKSGKRDAAQVMANGGLGMAACVGNALWPNPGWALFFVGVMASVTADTWATEWGSLSRKPPRSIVNGKPLSPGTSGGVSLLGSTAALAGAAIIGGAGWLLIIWSGLTSYIYLPLFYWMMIGSLSGFAGAMLDSYLGATLQSMYRCLVCGRSVEVTRHCDANTVPLRGLKWLNNDMVNMISSLAAGGIALVLGTWLIEVVQKAGLG